jgi:hypothetical protein
MPTLYPSHVAGDTLPAADWNAAFDAVEAAILDLGPYVITGLVPTAGTGLAANVTAGTASIGGRVTFVAFSITGLTPSTLNHLYVTNAGTGTSNTTGIAPANSAKLGTATTDGTGVTSVDTTPASGRQVKVDLTTVVAASNANLFTAQQTFRLNDAVATVSRPLVLQHGNSGGVGPANIGVGIDMQVETATESLYESAGRINATATAVTAGAVTGKLDLNVPNAGVFATVLSLQPAVAAFSVPLGGNGTAFSLKTLIFTFPSDANATLGAGQLDCAIIDIQAGVITATRTITVAGTGGGMYWVINRTAQSVTIKTAAGTGITIASARAALIALPAGLNAARLSADVDFSV